MQKSRGWSAPIFSGHSRHSPTILPARVWNPGEKETSHEFIKESPAFAVLFGAIWICVSKAQTATDKSASKTCSGKHYTLPAKQRNRPVGLVDPAEKTKAGRRVRRFRVNRDGLRPWDGEVKPGASMERHREAPAGDPGGGPHSVTGDIRTPTRRHAGNPHQKIVIRDSGFISICQAAIFHGGIAGRGIPEGRWSISSSMRKR